MAAAAAAVKSRPHIVEEEWILEDCSGSWSADWEGRSMMGYQTDDISLILNIHWFEYWFPTKEWYLEGC